MIAVSTYTVRSSLRAVIFYGYIRSPGSQPHVINVDYLRFSNVDWRVQLIDSAKYTLKACTYAHSNVSCLIALFHRKLDMKCRDAIVPTVY